MKLDIKTNKNGICEYFKINGQSLGYGIASIDIHIEGGKKPTLKLKGKLQELEFLADDVVIENSDNPYIRLIIDENKYIFLKENSVNVDDYKAKIVINNKIYDCIFENHAIFIEPGKKINKSIGKIKVLGNIDIDDFQTISKQICFDIFINDKKVKYYSYTNVTKTILGELKLDVSFIEY